MKLQLYHAKAETSVFGQETDQSIKLQLYHAKAETHHNTPHLKLPPMLQLYHAKAETVASQTSRACPPSCNFTMPKRKLNSRLIIAGSAVRVATLPCLSNYIKYTTLFSLLHKFNL